jgi:hypothetical protein
MSVLNHVMKKVSDIVENNKLFDSNAYRELTPVMQTAIKEVYKIIDEDNDITTENLVVKFENAIDSVVTKHSIQKEQLEDYFTDEITEQLGE